METTAEMNKPATAVGSQPRQMAKLSGRRILERDFKTADYSYSRWSVTLPEGWKYEDTLKPEFWSNVAHLLDKKPQTGQQERRGDIIEIRTVDHEFYAELYVQAVRKQALIVVPLVGPIKLTKDSKATATDKYIRKWNNKTRRHFVVRTVDNAIMGEGFDTKDGAHAFIDSLLED